MKRSKYTFDFSKSILSAFDISGSLLLSDFNWQSKGRMQDMEKLMKDLDQLEKDYKKATEKIAEEIEK